MSSGPPDKPSGADAAYAITKAGLSAIPIVGGPAAELLGQIVTPPLARRREQWLQELGERLFALEAKGTISIPSLVESDDFVDAVLIATRAAVSTASREKRAALRAAVLNVAQGAVVDAGVPAQIFLELLDRFTEWHLRFLTFFEDPVAYARSRGLQFPSVRKWSFEKLLLFVHPELAEQRPLYDLVWADLYRAGFVGSSSLQHVSIEADVPSCCLQDFGRAFMKFVREKET